MTEEKMTGVISRIYASIEANEVPNAEDVRAVNAEVVRLKHLAAMGRRNQRHCLYCEEPFLARVKQQVFCSPRCSGKAFRLIEGKDKRVTIPPPAELLARLTAHYGRPVRVEGEKENKGNKINR